MSEYTLMHKDIELSDFTFRDEDDTLLDIKNIRNKEHIPPRALKSDADFFLWWKNRAIPRTRKDLPSFLTIIGKETTEGYLIKNLALSLSDCYWIKPFGSSLKWSDVSLYKNDFPFSYDLNFIGESFNPNASTCGDQPKTWVIENGRRILLKKGDSVGSIQCRNELFATKIHLSQNYNNFVPYSLVEKNRTLFSSCPAFTNEEVEFISAWDIIGRKNFSQNEPFRKNFIEFCLKEGLEEEKIANRLDYMTMTDFLISNYDRHFNNFGIIRNPDSLRLIDIAPLFDFGNSMGFNHSSPFSLASLIKEKTTGFNSSYRASINNVRNKNIVDISKLPLPDVIDEIYPNTEFVTKKMENLKKLYSSRIEIIAGLQEGKNFYDLASQYSLLS